VRYPGFHKVCFFNNFFDKCNNLCRYVWDTADEATGLVRDLRAQLGASRADASGAHARLALAEEAAALAAAAAAASEVGLYSC
jgi:hypothetical protein